MAYKFSVQRFENNEEHLDRDPEFRDTINDMVDTAQTVNSVGWRPDTGVKLFSYLVANGVCVNIIEIFEPNCNAFPLKSNLVKVYHGDICKFDQFIPVEDRDVLIWQDGPEHLPLEVGKETIKRMQQDFNGIVIATPNGEYPQSNLFENDAERHLSGWTIEDYEEIGFKVVEYNPQTPESCHPVDSFLIGYWSKEIDYETV